MIFLSIYMQYFLTLFCFNRLYVYLNVIIIIMSVCVTYFVNDYGFVTESIEKLLECVPLFYIR